MVVIIIALMALGLLALTKLRVNQIPTSSSRCWW
jgi:multidrug efflux pump subunit AcrB